VIDFKQFLTTIAAIFLALAVGVALGAGPLKGTADEQLRINAEKLSKDKDTLQKQILADQAQAKYQDSFADAISPELVSGRLTERKVAIVTLPGANGAYTKAITTLVDAADGTVTGTIAVQSKFLDPTQAQFVDGVTTQSSGAVGTADLEVPTTATGYERAGYVLARALVSKGNGAGQDATAQTILAAFKDAGLVKAPNKLERASLVVVIAGPAPAPADLDSIDPTAAVGLLLGLDASCEGTVVAGPPEAAADNGTIALIRADDDAKKVISTVDQAQLPAGRVSAIFALVEQIDGKTGHYGMVGKVDAAAPKLTSP
jgi:Copper transport outer membrane protein, MctB